MKVKVESFARDLVSYHVPPDLRNFENVKHLAGTFPGAEADEIRRLLIIKKKKKKNAWLLFSRRERRRTRRKRRRRIIVSGAKPPTQPPSERMFSARALFDAWLEKSVEKLAARAALSLFPRRSN